MHWLAVVVAITVSYQPQAKPAEQSGIPEESLKAFEHYCVVASMNANVSDDLVEDGSTLLFLRTAHFVQVYGETTPAEALKAAKRVTQIPEVSELAARLDTGPIEIEKREQANAAADREWVIERQIALSKRADVDGLGLLLTDLDLPLPGRVRVDVLSEAARAEQLASRRAILLAALGDPAEVTAEQIEAASRLAEEQLGRDYARSNGYWVNARGDARACALIEVDAVAEAILDWVGPALRELEGVENLTLAPVDSGWVVVDADTGWSLRDPTLARFSGRDVIMFQKGLQARDRADTAASGAPRPHREIALPAR